MNTELILKRFEQPDEVTHFKKGKFETLENESGTERTFITYESGRCMACNTNQSTM